MLLSLYPHLIINLIIAKEKHLMNFQQKANSISLVFRKQFVNYLYRSFLFTLLITSTSCQQNTTDLPTQTASPSPTSETSPAATTSSSQSDLVDDLENYKGTNKLGGYWYVYNDKGMGGDSKVSPSGQFKPSAGGANNSKYSALMTGEVTTKSKSPFIGMGTNLNKEGTAVDISQYKGIEFCAKGDGQKYFLKLRSLANNDFDDYSFTFIAPADWKCYRVPFADTKQSGFGKPVPLGTALAQVTSLQWQTIGKPHKTVELAIDDIKFWK
jgi:hypothetical protein